ncbi:DUF397 domain-containing protein [Lentzea tibetensis]|uniref:DUF397 domain-containing protein n=1 Tax=Lentzea tibetensis TaxID=2591470 RepID=A0A563EJ31_9PSEU|nr:DUF397 domain-containing protein [Lentzea tibetensis]
MAQRNSAQEEPAGLRWVKSSASGNEQGACVELATTGEVVFVRDSKVRDGGRLTFEWSAWASFIASSKAR